MLLPADPPGRTVLTKDLPDLLIEIEFSLLNKEADRHPCDRFAHGMGDMPHIPLTGSETALSDHIPVPEDHRVMRVGLTVIRERPEILHDMRRADTLGLRCGPRKGLTDRKSLKRRLLRRIVNAAYVSGPAAQHPK